MPFRGRVGGLATGLASVGLLAGAVVAGVGGSGAVAHQVELGPGWAWFASPVSGQVSLIDGPTATRVSKVVVGAPGDVVEVVGAGADAWVVNRSALVLRRVESSTLEVGDPLSPGGPGSVGHPGFRVVADSVSTWVVVQGGRAVQEIDHESGVALGGLVAVSGSVAGAVLGVDGTLWVTDTQTSVVSSFRHGRERSSREVAGAQGAPIVMVGESPVVVRLDDRPAVVLDGDGGGVVRETCFSGSGRDGLLVGGSGKGRSWLFVVNPVAATLTVVDTRSGRCQPLALGQPSDDATRYGVPVEHNGLVFVADTVAGTVIVADPTKSADAVIRTIDLGLAGHQFNLSAENGFVWFDDPDSDTAGVIFDDLRAKLVHKTDGDGTPTDPKTPSNEPDDPGHQAAVCRSRPEAPVVGQPVTLDVIPNRTDVSPDAWLWDVPDGQFLAGNKGTQVTVTFATAGQHHAEANAPPIGGVPPHCETTINVNEEGTQATPPPAITIPPTTIEPPVTTPLATTPPATTPPPVTEPPVTEPPVTTSPTTTASGSAPVALVDFNPKPAIVGQDVTFTNTSTGDITKYDWIFAGPAAQATSNVREPINKWSVAGSYNVILTVTDSAGAANSKSIMVDVQAPEAPLVPDFALPPPPYTPDTDLTFTDKSTGPVVSRTWTFQNGSPNSSAVPNPTVRWANDTALPLKVDITLKVTGSNGLTNQVTKRITIDVKILVVPDVLGVDEATARQALAAFNVTATNIPAPPCTTPHLSHVVSTTPAAGAPAATGSTVDLSLTPNYPVTVPAVIGQPSAAALTTLAEFENVQVQQAYNPAPADQVFNLSVPVGTPLPRCSPITMKVSLGPPRALTTLTDAIGDAGAGNPDLSSVSVAVNGTQVVFAVRFAPGTFDLATSGVAISLDLDLNPSTGHSGIDSGCTMHTDLGTDMVLSVRPSLFPDVRVLTAQGGCNAFSISTIAGAVSRVSDGYDVVVDLAQLANDDGVFNFVLTATRQLSATTSTGILDVISNEGLPPGSTKP